MLSAILVALYCRVGQSNKVLRLNALNDPTRRHHYVNRAILSFQFLLGQRSLAYEHSRRIMADLQNENVAAAQNPCRSQSTPGMTLRSNETTDPVKQNRAFGNAYYPEYPPAAERRRRVSIFPGSRAPKTMHEATNP
ncbi:hypothetical protein CC79DRAFT_157974 [Sarocladium strictum]